MLRIERIKLAVEYIKNKKLILNLTKFFSNDKVKLEVYNLSKVVKDLEKASTQAIFSAILRHNFASKANIDFAAKKLNLTKNTHLCDTRSTVAYAMSIFDYCEKKQRERANAIATIKKVVKKKTAKKKTAKK